MSETTYITPLPNVLIARLEKDLKELNIPYKYYTEFQLHCNLDLDEIQLPKIRGRIYDEHTGAIESEIRPDDLIKYVEKTYHNYKRRYTKEERLRILKEIISY